MGLTKTQTSQSILPVTQANFQRMTMMVIYNPALPSTKKQVTHTIAVLKETQTSQSILPVTQVSFLHMMMMAIYNQVLPSMTKQVKHTIKVLVLLQARIQQH